ncbi:hypothetical protein DFH06DRAFT_997660 [Mycena polygramma]|nr:hypothetical protein DFH06DRAFT_997660 [Mycena polygramma]
MYMFCWQRGLREVWGYLWTSWYSPKRWALWARSTSPFLSRLRTTMNVENFWKQLKHGFLHNHARPRLDLLVWILIVVIFTAAYLVRANALSDGYRMGRSKPLTPFQKQFKAAWLALMKLSLSDDADKKYITSIANWTCTCKSQKFHCCHLCKHLVHAVGSLPPYFWCEVVRRRTVPLYRHPLLVAKDEEPEEYLEPTDGNVTDGDDHAWFRNRSVLEGGGGWREFDFSSTSLLGKRDRASGDSDFEDARDEEEVEQSMFTGADLDSPDISTDNHNIELLRKRTDELVKGAEILRAQANARNALWMKSMVRKDIGKDVSLMVADVRRSESSRRNRDNTWGNGGKTAKRRVKNTMGIM